MVTKSQKEVPELFSQHKWHKQQIVRISTRGGYEIFNLPEILRLMLLTRKDENPSNGTVNRTHFDIFTTAERAQSKKELYSNIK